MAQPKKKAKPILVAKSRLAIQKEIEARRAEIAQGLRPNNPSELDAAKVTPRASIIADVSNTIKTDSLALKAKRKAGEAPESRFVQRRGERAGMQFDVIKRGNQAFRRYRPKGQTGGRIDEIAIPKPRDTNVSTGGGGLPGPASEQPAGPGRPRPSGSGTASLRTAGGTQLKVHPTTGPAFSRTSPAGAYRLVWNPKNRRVFRQYKTGRLVALKPGKNKGFLDKPLG